MSKSPTKSRDVALSALRDRAGNVTARLNRLLAQGGLSGAESALARELALGVVRRRRTLDAVLARFIRIPESVTGKVRDVMRLGAYQLLFLERVPAFAAVNEAVAQVGQRGMRGLVNGVLRNIARAVGEPIAGPPPLKSDVIAISPGSYRQLDRQVFPDPKSEPAGFLAEAMSLPDELAGRWLASLGSLAAAVNVAAHANARPPMIFRVNAARAAVSDVLSRLASAGVQAEPHVNRLSVVLTSGADPASLEVFREGLVQPQDPAATAVVAAAPVRPGMRVLDLCAAPGTKTTHLAERMADRGEIVACDVSPEKLARIEDNCRRMGVSIVRTVPAEQVASLAERPFDVVLVDAPCTNTGVLARRCEARWRFTAKGLAAMARDQEQLLYLATELTRPGGTIVYSTCSLEEEENARVIRAVLGRQRFGRLIEQRPVLPAGADEPTRWRDGGYSATLGCS